jgi:signal transduction histidine kinase
MRFGFAPEARSTLAARLAWLTGLRLLVLLALLGATAFFYLRGSLTAYPDSMRIVLGTFGGAFALSVGYAVWLRRGRGLDVLAWSQLAFDQLTWTAIVYVSGGAASGATSFYGLTCVLGAVLVGFRGALAAGGTGIALYGLLSLGLHYGWVAAPRDQVGYATTGSALLYPLLINVLGIAVVSVLSGYLAERLQATGGALVEATRRYREAERLAELGRLASWLAHEIRNPLGSIRGSIEMLRESPAMGDEDRILCDIVQREALRLNDLVGDMLDLSRARKPVAEAVDVAALAQDVVALAGRSASTGVSVVYEGPVSAKARCDGAQMRQVVWNLVRNALQASPSGERVTVKVAKGDRVVLTVTDAGKGVDEKVADRIFDAFYTTRVHGAGIGLAVVKRIIDDHASLGASISVTEGEGGRGASFRVSLDPDVVGLRASIRPPGTS